MAITAVFDVPGMTEQQYDAVIERLDAAGEGAPAGRISHLAAQAESGWYVVDVWDNEADFGRFASVLLPLLADAGVTPPQPRILATHNLVAAQSRPPAGES